MARKLKTYITNLGFFELAIAAPSMKAALEAWGMSHNAFQHGFAKATDDPDIVAAATAKPGTVLKRAVGTFGPFQEDARLPDTLPNIRPPGKTAPKPKARSRHKESPGKSDAGPAAVISFEKARRRRDKERAKEEAQRAKEKAARKRATDKAESALEKARQAHRKVMDAIARDQEKLDRRSEKEAARWEIQQEKLAGALERARD